MYKIIAADSKEGAILQKENGEFCFYSLWFFPVREKWLQGFRKSEIEVFVERGAVIRHNPPTPVEKLEDWPKVAAQYEAAHKRTQDQQDQDAVHAVAP